MIDFFDEDFPLTKKQEEMLKAMKEAEKKAALGEAPKPDETNPLPADASPVAVEQTAEAATEPIKEAAPEAVPETIAETAAATAAAQAYKRSLVDG